MPSDCGQVISSSTPSSPLPVEKPDAGFVPSGLRSRHVEAVARLTILSARCDKQQTILRAVREGHESRAELDGLLQANASKVAAAAAAEVAPAPPPADETRREETREIPKETTKPAPPVAVAEHRPVVPAQQAKKSPVPTPRTATAAAGAGIGFAAGTKQPPAPKSAETKFPKPKWMPPPRDVGGRAYCRRRRLPFLFFRFLVGNTGLGALRGLLLGFCSRPFFS